MTRIRSRIGEIDGLEGRGLVAFLGIPYAAPPIGALRWRPPTAPPARQGVLDATRHPNRAFARPLPASLGVGATPGAMSEDMLYLNVFTPRPDRRSRPVLVWIHGGGFIQGSANDFDPSKFARENDLVVVALNYRLGMLGFLDLSRFGPDYAGSASLGFQDQIFALRWVQQNVEDFGGDPENVTICGGSAGGGSVLALMSAPSARGLFQRAIAISPSEISPAPPDVVTPYAAALGMSEPAFLDHLLALPAEEIFRLQTEGGVGGLACVDGAIVTHRIADAIAAGINNVPLIAGSTLNEGPMLTAEFGGREDVYRFFEAGLAQMTSGGEPQRYLVFLDSLAAGLSPEARMNRAWYDFFRASALRPTHALAAAGVPAWTYVFQVPTDHPYGPTHGSDVRFAFNLFDAETGEGQEGAFYRNTAANRRVARSWSRALARFVRTGEPGAPGLARWPAYSPTAPVTLLMDAPARLAYGYDPESALRAYGIN